MATLVLGEAHFLPFTLRPRQEVLDELDGQDVVLADYLRDAIARHLRRRLCRVPHFYFVIEDREKDGITPTRPHVHGCIAHDIVELPLTSAGNIMAKWRRLADAKGERHAKLEYAKRVLRDALAGAGGYRRSPVVMPGRNVWFAREKLPIFQDQYVNYAFKNAAKVSPLLGERRLVMSRPLTNEARRLWELVRNGESAIDQWEAKTP